MPAATPNALSLMLAQLESTQSSYVVEVTKAKMGRDSIVKLEVSDGDHQAKAYLDASGSAERERAEKLLRGGVRNLMLVREHAVHSFNGTPCLEIISFDNVEQEDPQVKLEPEDANTKADLLQGGPVAAPAREERTKREEGPKMEAEVGRPGEQSSQGRANQAQEQPNSRMQNEQQQSLEEITAEKLSLSDKLSDLYPDFPGEWHIIVRLLDKSYREFTSRSGKEIRLLTMQLIDRTATKLEAVMFGEEATELAGRLAANEVYRMAKGQIKEHAYAHTLPQGYSNLSIVFGRNSQVVRVREVREIPRNGRQEVRIRELPTYMDEEKPLDVVGVLLEIHEEKETVKEDGRVFHRRNIVVGDPESHKSVDVLIWGRKFPISPAVLNKTILLRNFKLHLYKQSVSLSSTHKSSIVPLPAHPFTTAPTPHYASLSHTLKLPNSDERPPLTTIIELEQELHYHHDSQEAVSSELQVWVSYVNFKNRWYYSACNNPKCKKSTEPHARCAHCGSTNAELTKKFNLQVEVSDFTGSLWICAFDELVGELFKGWRAEEMSGMSDQQRKEEADKRIFQRQYLVKIVSRKDGEGYVRHMVVGKPAVMEIDETMVRNVERIKKALY